MKDKFGRKIDYLRLSITDRCNLRCIYCHNGEFEKVEPSSVISYEEIFALVSHLKNKGLRAVKITGGEPLLRKDITYCIEKLVEMDLEVSLTTNGTLLNEKAAELYEAGLRRINIGIDCLEKSLFSKLTGADLYQKAVDGLNKSLEVGFDPVKINVVLIKGLNEEIDPWLKLAAEKEVCIRFIEVMPFVNGHKPVRCNEIKTRLKEMGKIKEISIQGRGPAEYFKVEGFRGTFGFISPVSSSFCSDCSRLRLNAQGQLRSCLFSPKTFNIRKVLRVDYSKEKLDSLIEEVLAKKPIDNKGLEPVENMCQIGG